MSAKARESQGSFKLGGTRESFEDSRNTLGSIACELDDGSLEGLNRARFTSRILKVLGETQAFRVVGASNRWLFSKYTYLHRLLPTGAPGANDKPDCLYLTGAFGSTVPFALAVSGPPEPFFDFSGSSSIL